MQAEFKILIRFKYNLIFLRKIQNHRFVDDLSNGNHERD